MDAVQENGQPRMAYPDAWVYRFDADGIHRVGFEDTEHFRVMRAFMANPRQVLDSLLL